MQSPGFNPQHLKIKNKISISLNSSYVFGFKVHNLWERDIVQVIGYLPSKHEVLVLPPVPLKPYVVMHVYNLSTQRDRNRGIRSSRPSLAIHKVQSHIFSLKVRK